MQGMIKLDQILDLNCLKLFLYNGAICGANMKLHKISMSNNDSKMLITRKRLYGFCSFFNMF